MKDFWDKRYSETEYAYGVQPNTYIKQNIDKLSPGTILFPAEGEGGNAVYAAKEGWQVTAFDNSEVAKTKDLKLA